MKLFKESYRVETIRLQSWDYSWPGWYYVTVCTKNMDCFFGDIANEKMTRSAMGEIAFRCWSDIPNHFPNVELDEFEIMPNHVHGIIIINDKPVETLHCNVSLQSNVSTPEREGINKRMSAISPKPGSLGAIVRSFKSAVSKECRKRGHRGFGWQERFYDHIIRNDQDLHRIRTYIHNNVLAWELEKTYPEDFLKEL